MKDFDPSRPNLELSQGKLASLYTGIAGALIRSNKGELNDDPTVYPPVDGSTPYIFKLPLPPQFVRKVFYPEDKDTIVGSDCYVSYASPHRLEDEDHDAVSESVYVSLQTKLVGTEVACNQSISLGCVNDQYDGLFETEYVDLETGWVISPDDVPRGLDITNEELRRSLLDDMLTLARPLSFDDAEKLRKIEELITAA